LFAAFRSDDIELRQGFVEVLRRSAFQTLTGLAQPHDEGDKAPAITA
jgi:hypothetical protein